MVEEEAAILAHDIVCRLSRTVDVGWTMLGVFGFVETDENVVVRFDDETAEDERGFRCCTVDLVSLLFGLRLWRARFLLWFFPMVVL